MSRNAEGETERGRHREGETERQRGRRIERNYGRKTVLRTFSSYLITKQ